MEKEFVPYELAVKLKELGFDEPCLAHYIKNNQYKIDKDRILLRVGRLDYDDIYKEYVLENVPLWQQAFDWFREEYNYHYEIFLSDEPPYNKFHYRIMQIGKYFTLSYDDFEGTYEEARQACLKKLIELCQQN